MTRNYGKAWIVAGIAFVIVAGYTISHYCCRSTVTPVVITIPAEVKVWWNPEISKQLKAKIIQDESKARSGVKLPQPPTGCPSRGGLIPETDVLDTLNEDLLRIIYRDYLSNSELICNVMFRMGKVADGGWEVCNDDYVRPKSNCLVYSFGISYDFSFDDMIGQRYGCEVHSFDPSMSMGDTKRSENVVFHSIGVSGSNGYINFNWPVKTLADIRKMLGHTGRHIDVLKMDVEGSEWETLTTALNDGSLKNVSQFLLETHIYNHKRASLLSNLKILKKLRDQGFRIFYAHKNPNCPHGLRTETPHQGACHEIHMLHIPACDTTV